MARITSIGHVGIYCDDVERMKDFYTRVLGLQVTHAIPAEGLYFLTPDPAQEHHMIFLRQGERGDGKVIQQLSMHTSSIAEVREYWRRLKAEGAPIQQTITHGTSVSVYFFDPEGNRLEIYWATPYWLQAPGTWPLDLDADDETILAQVQAHVAERGGALQAVQA
jgi:catechol 2,3-dioxygenase-like lactoylglutathione lyase family enzyme